MGFLRASLVVFLVAMAPSISSAAATNTVSSTVVTDKAMREQARTIKYFMKKIYKKLRLIKRMSRQKRVAMVPSLASAETNTVSSTVIEHVEG
jgi:hypothetical protein